MIKPWTDDEIAILIEMRKNGLPYSHIGEKLGRSRNSAISKAYQLAGYRRIIHPDSTMYMKKTELKVNKPHQFVEPYARFKARKVAERAAQKTLLNNAPSSSESPEK